MEELIPDSERYELELTAGAGADIIERFHNIGDERELLTFDEVRSAAGHRRDVLGGYGETAFTPGHVYPLATLDTRGMDNGTSEEDDTRAQVPEEIDLADSDNERPDGHDREEP